MRAYGIPHTNGSIFYKGTTLVDNVKSCLMKAPMSTTQMEHVVNCKQLLSIVINPVILTMDSVLIFF